MALWLRLLLVTGPPDAVAEASRGHREQVRALGAAGRLRIAGALGRDEGFVEVFEAVDRRDAEEVARASPLVEAGLGSWLLREWRDADAGG